ncbi:cation diffusion facilitator family transporter [Coraliomargarita sp. SDUM461004]|uniref:Cation diffusion facilitator family transporter n=1 Tax=Thalassobacterium sedimentorum TaxID=3041258 RepID=A0ABU1ADZ4_9BACT|nr:cation diffusion facilitator family transporter [Coraliomargarita sp. SDUM461004]MDQ8192868.1 cation diffusion facilitator family transporter [Coraliomargarita sp. SDUM461004]
MSLKSTATQITWIGLFLNLIIGCIKVFGGWALQSKALLADGAHSLLDLLTDIAVLVGLSLASKPEDENHHYGHHKFASFAKFCVGGMLLLFSLGLVVTALIDYRSGFGAPKAGDAVLLAFVSLVLKEALFWWTRHVARRLKSDLLMANAWHHRMDSLSSLGVVIALIGVWLGGENWAFLDDAVTLVLGGYLIFESTKIFLRACSDLLDAAPEREIVEDLREHILPIQGAVAYHDFRVRRVGDLYEVDLHLQVDPEISVEAGHAIARAVKRQMCEKHPEVSKVLVHVEPANREHIMNRGLSGQDISEEKSAPIGEI